MSTVPSEISTSVMPCSVSQRAYSSSLGQSSNRSVAAIELLQLLLVSGLDVVVERVAVSVDPDRKRPEILDAELPEALGHQLRPGLLLDLLDLRRLERGRAADDGEVDH